ncbi:lipoyl synthase [Clostridium kluyveri]|uniref:Lipoyl synthase n=1 Tax=Clostridium kluyveri (strain ATCC 8527 / DSM 555 / NBRC 12016 / NCIMB 10680 / K1) TaxID=431943 RepID=A5MZI9_CLOK5|nr:lipoyl synthase [Clostridium kluyveri]EDK34285.1 LipA2 [Clostridium kluyveri DSM 555]
MGKRPEWLKMKVPDEKVLTKMENMVRNLSLHTVCESAVCPNIGKCFKSSTATFMVLGNTCTRNCRFCAVNKGHPEPLNIEEPKNVAIASKKLGLKHTVITSVTRDDLEDGGADHFVEIIKRMRKENPQSTIELLIPDLRGNWKSLKKIIDAKPDILNHNVETVEILYGKVRPTAVYSRSIELLRQVKIFDKGVYTKSGIMVGLGETEEQVMKVMDDLLEVGCDIMTIGQYLRPSKSHIPVYEYISPEQFEKYKQIAIEKGFKFVASAPYVRSSYRAYEGIKTLEKIK